jgi:hypothetical protein
LELLFLFAKEGWVRSVLGEYHTQKQALSRFFLGAMILSDPASRQNVGKPLAAYGEWISGSGLTSGDMPNTRRRHARLPIVDMPLRPLAHVTGDEGLVPSQHPTVVFVLRAAQQCSAQTTNS